MTWFDIREVRPVRTGFYRVFTKSGKHVNSFYDAREDLWDLPAGEKISNWSFQETGKEILERCVRR